MFKVSTGEDIRLDGESLFPAPHGTNVLRCAEHQALARAPRQPFQFDRWYNEYSGLVRALIGRYIKDADVREDLNQIVWARLAKVGERYDPTRSKETTFVGLIARRAVIDHLEREARRSKLLPGATSPTSCETDLIEIYGRSRDSTPLEAVIAEEQRRVLTEHLAELAPRQRDILYARFYHGLSYQVLAEEFDIPLGTAKSLINRTLARIRRAMKEPNR